MLHAYARQLILMVYDMTDYYCITRILLMPGEHMPGIGIPTGYGERSRQGINVVQIYMLPECKDVACYEDENR